MQFAHVHYLPLPLEFFAILAGIFVVLVLLLQIGALQYAYTRLGISSGAAILLLLASLIGSYFNIPIAEFPERNIASGEEIDFFGMRYVVPVVTQWPGTILTINVGGALIPGLMSVYLFFRNALWLRGIVAIICVAAVCYWLARPTPGLGIAMPALAPAIITTFVALLLGRNNPAPLAYVAGSLGTLIGADILNLGRIPGLGAPIASIGGAGTFDSVFLTGILAVLFASLSMPRRSRR